MYVDGFERQVGVCCWGGIWNGMFFFFLIDSGT